MKAITVRDAANKLICFGPDNGMYDPGILIGGTRQLEDDYEAVKAEYFSSLPPAKTESQLEKEKLLALLEDPDIKLAIKALTALPK